ncbi:MAG: methionine synthase [bacterium]
MDVIFFHRITIPAPIELIYRRLGYTKGKTKLKKAQKDTLNKYIDEAMDLITLRGSALRVGIKKKTSVKTILENGIEFKSKDLARMLKKSNEVLLMGTSAGPEIMQKIKEDSKNKNLTRAVVFDAVGSEIADDALNWITDYINREIRREGKYLSKKRFSAGYGDLSIKNQQIIYDTLHLEHIGVVLLKNYMLIPEKSVTAISGIEEME